MLIVYINQLLPINLKSTKIIEYDEQYVFGFVEIEYNDDIHPLNGCFLKPFDLSINLLIKLKWLNWVILFFKTLSLQISMQDIGQVGRESSVQQIVFPERSPHKFLVSFPYKGTTVSFEIFSVEDVYKVVNMNDSDSDILFKLKLNIDEYLALSGYIWPTLIKRA